MDWSILMDLLKGLGVGMFTSLAGYFKSIPDGEAFDIVKAIPTMVIGAITGIVAYIMHQDLTSAATLIEGFGVVVIVNHLWSYLVKVHKKAALPVQVAK